MPHIEFRKLEAVNNPTSIHGIYPYRGKISALEAKFVVEQLPNGTTLLDPFCGSGTIVFEGLCRDLGVYGVDNNPLAMWVCRGKVDSLSKDVAAFEDEAKKLVDRARNTSSFDEMPVEARKYFHRDSAEEIMRMATSFESMSNYAKACFLGAVALAARGCNQYKWTSSTVGKDITPKRYVPFFDKFIQKVKKHHPKRTIPFKKPKLFLDDSRRLSELIPSKSVDFVFTSPPYFDGLDYTAYYGKIIYEILRVNRNEIKEGLIQTIRTYKNDMEAVFKELIRVTKDNALLIFVVGDKKVGSKIINGGEFFSGLLQHKPNQIIERVYTGTSSQVFDSLNRTRRKEQIVVWDRGCW